MINLGEGFEVLAPAVLELPKLHSLPSRIGRERHPWMPVLGVPEHEDAAVGMMAFERMRSTTAKRRRPTVVGNFAVRAEQVGVIVARVQHRSTLSFQPRNFQCQ